ncbi:MAG: glycosyltransferase family 2 protein [Pseudomonadota bacterium]|nr:glycosyltransferase family 2 protein [Pseudomonadota bacterium]
MLPGLEAAAEPLSGEVIIVNFGGDPERLKYQLAHVGLSTRVVEVSGQQWFHKARAQNAGANFARHDLMFFCDCDILLDAPTVGTLARKVITNPGIFATLAGVSESRRNARQARHVVRFGYELSIKTADGRELHILDSEEDAADGTRQAPGLLLVRRDDFTRIDGYNGKLHGWGWEDQDMIARLTLGAGLRRISEGHAVHLSHDDATRTARYPLCKDRWESRDRMFRQALDAYDRNDFAGTFSRDRSELSCRLINVGF